MITVDKEGIEAVIGELSNFLNGQYLEAGMYIGQLRSGKVVKLVVMDENEAEIDGFDGDHAGLIES